MNANKAPNPIKKLRIRKVKAEDLAKQIQTIFILAEIEFDETRKPVDLDEIQIQIILNNSLNALFGEIGMIGAVPKILRHNTKNKTVILESTDDNAEKLRQALFFTDGGSSLGNELIKLKFKILNVSKFLSTLDVNSRNDFF